MINIWDRCLEVSDRYFSTRAKVVISRNSFVDERIMGNMSRSIRSLANFSCSMFVVESFPVFVCEVLYFSVILKHRQVNLRRICALPFDKFSY